ncbi:MAG: ABC transporter ATP-binding protein [Candidatus Rokubacteria bacterium]|nr:ABC transporter ATP-binding protein [Candidatus Rokubacteria bacterium]
MLALESVSAGYGRLAALRDVTLEVRRGELVCLLGANGAGKSTTLKTISGLLAPRSGRVVFDGEAISGLAAPAIVRRGIAHCPEGRRVFPYLTVEENLRIGAWTRRDGVAAELDAVVAHFPILGERRRQAAGTLSGGEQQMLAIGRALMSRPRLLLLDEPSLGLAPAAADATFRIVGDIRDRGTTVLMVEQNAYAALRMADRAYVMETGRITLAGAARDLLRDEHVRRAYLGG